MSFKIMMIDQDYKYIEALKAVIDQNIYELNTFLEFDDIFEEDKSDQIDLWIIDLDEKNFTLDFLLKLKNHSIGKKSSVLGITANHSIEKMVEAKKYGMDNYHLKSRPTEELLSLIELLTKRDLETPKLESFILKSNNEKFKKSLEIAKKAAKSDVNILILGESGVGKEVFAKYIHQCSDRLNEPFVTVNCHTYSENLLESELFGHEKGSFTGASQSRKGKFEESDKGTLFLDEVGDISLDIQVKLLRTIENKTLERIGSNKTQKLDFRLISATNQNLQSDIFYGKFREDFFYRISTIVIEIPPIRERKEDLKMLIDFFMSKISNQFKKEILYIENEVEEFLYTYDYPGNIRELINIIDRLIVLSENGIISAENLPICVGYKKESKTQELFDTDIIPLREKRKEFEKKYITRVLKKCNNNQTEAAKLLEISRRQLINKIEEYGLRKK